ncbi:endonuclease/exonuclease/phosphatase family protein [Asanoa sp. WMMD1127]|uniref:endonuclease/exonuclease/phosphatase family protein n=1 Tax=Asanoa sp. WMMD1127 TaxID=3016107 RepID=UPI00241752FA|nr:endonuclease/exonuclease/phosphatase family protein [Asanoa sp. WMMD1127]MDG4826064.1 endonuclease/exonuclease/phosphatase family protein [Asanoa sp. WMMD1127]
MRLATFNVLHGRSIDDGIVDRQRFAESVAKIDADVLALQEVDRLQPRSGSLDLTAVAAEAAGAVAWRFVAAVVGTPGETYRPLAYDDDGAAEPNYGIGLVSRYPVRSWRTVRLSASPVPGPIYAMGPGGRGRPMLLRDEPRALVMAVLDTPWGPVSVGATHLSFVPGWNVWQLRQVVRAMRTLPAPRLLLGDLNLPAGAAAVGSGWRPLGRLPTFPSSEPRVQLDHVLADPRGWGSWPSSAEASTPALTVSDHRPLVVDLPLNGS